ncbi:MAG: DUF89 family protein, partial [Dehalococcoidia bacterium]|nr:DUF89 family protein [Dehalococcoidia bacterium]
MKIYLDCLPCLMNQALKAARAATDDEAIQRDVLNATAAMMPDLPPGLKPPEMAQHIYRLVDQITGNHDPYRKAKAEANEAVLALYPHLKRLIADSPDPLLTACKLAIGGNSIDLGPNFEQVDVSYLVESSLSSPLCINDYEKLRSSLSSSRQILYLGDNAGEIVFDRLLIEELQRARKTDVYFVVRGGPVVNDATLDDAVAVGLDKVATVVPNGSDAPAR